MKFNYDLSVYHKLPRLVDNTHIVTNAIPSGNCSDTTQFSSSSKKIYY